MKTSDSIPRRFQRGDVIKDLSGQQYRVVEVGLRYLILDSNIEGEPHKMIRTQYAALVSPADETAADTGSSNPYRPQHLQEAKVLL